jgi:hypothetical protein
MHFNLMKYFYSYIHQHVQGEDTRIHNCSMMTHLTTTVYLCHHPEDGWTTGQNILVNIFKCICWLLIYFTSTLQLRIYCTKAEKIWLSDHSPTIIIQQYYFMFMLNLCTMKTYSFSFMLGLYRPVCDIISLKSASKQGNKIINHRDIYYYGTKVFCTDFNSKHFMNHCHIYSTYITNSFTQ